MKKGDWLYGDGAGLVEVVGCGTEVVRLCRYGTDRSYTKPRGAMEVAIARGALRNVERGDPVWERGKILAQSAAMTEIKEIMDRYGLVQISLQTGRAVALGSDGVVFMNDEEGNLLMPLT